MIAFDFDWIDAKAEGDPLDAATFASLEIGLGAYVLTRVFDRNTRSERDRIFFPLYPLVRWIVDHWWALLYEPENPAGRPEPGNIGDNPTLRPWIERHSLRVAVPGYALPYACIYSAGTQVAVTFHQDPAGCYPHTPVEFHPSFDLRNEVLFSREQLGSELAKLVASVLSRVENLDDGRAHALRTDWKAIYSADSSESEFCRAAGRIGLDPYRSDSWPVGLLEWFESTDPGGLDEPLLADLLEAPGLDTSKPRQHEALRKIVARQKLGAGSSSIGPGITADRPFEIGYEWANWLRKRIGLKADEKLTDISNAAEAACGRPLKIVTGKTIPEGQILGLTGWSPTNGPIVVCRPSFDQGRFVSVRGLFLGLRSTGSGPRLITDAKTQVQKSSRAFAAELLAPRMAVRNFFEEERQRVGKDEAIHRIAKHFEVNSLMVEHQIENARKVVDHAAVVPV